MRIRTKFLNIDNRIKRMSLEWCLIFFWFFLAPISIPLTLAFKVGQIWERKRYENPKMKRQNRSFMTGNDKKQESILTEVRF